MTLLPVCKHDGTSSCSVYVLVAAHWLASRGQEGQWRLLPHEDPWEVMCAATSAGHSLVDALLGAGALLPLPLARVHQAAIASGVEALA